MRSLLPLLLPLSAMVSSVALAAESGSIRGKVTNGEGVPLPGVEIVLSGPNIGGQLTVTSDGEGGFRFASVPPGNHEMAVLSPDFAPMRRKVTVRLDETVTVPLVLARPTGSAEIEVVETLPVIDATRSAVSTNLSADFIQNIPSGRSYQDVVNTVPGVYGRIDTQNGGPSGGNPSVRGEGQYGNNYLLDGISTRDPATKTFGASVNFDAIQEIQVYTDGLPAEFSQATGMLVNVVTKDGGDEHHGSAGYWAHLSASSGEYDILDIDLGAEVPTSKRKFLNHELSLTAGGPLLPEKLWYFAAADLAFDNIQYEGTEEGTEYISQGGEAFGKVTFFLNPQLTLQYQLGGSRTAVDNYDTSGLFSTEAQAQYASTDMTNIFTARLQPDARSELELKLSTLNSDISVVPMSGDEDTPQVYDYDTGTYTGNYDSFDINKRSRLGGSLIYTRLVDGVVGDHKFKLGGELWSLQDSRQLIFTGPGDGTQYWSSAANGRECTAADDKSDCYGYTTYEDVGALGHRARITGIFIQDDWQPVDPLTLNIGARLDHEALFQNEGDQILSQFMPAPRLGLAWDITQDSKTVFTANVGRYYDVNGNAFADWGDTRSAYVYREFQYNESTDDFDLIWEQDPATDPLIYCTDQSLAAIEDPDIKTAADAACGETRLKPYHMDKAVVGIQRELIPLLAIGVKGIMSKTRDIPEDVDYDLNTWVITNPETKKRDYRALEFTLNRKSDGVWSGLASYTLSEAKGTTPGQFELASGGLTGSDGNQVGVYLDDVNDEETRQAYFDAGYGWLLDGLSGLGRDGDDAGYYGYLPYHSFHQVKVAGSYTLPFGTTLGAVYEFDSGHAWQKRGMVELYGDYFAFPEGRGTRSMPAVHYFDLRVAHEFEIGDSKAVEISADAFNVLDFESPINYYENDNELFGLTMYRQSPRSVQLGARFTY
jgi:Carboxypeptidase regulatory-like domain/TonB-dependent Receptor Plug Domain